jgi:hypothetical protein
MLYFGVGAGVGASIMYDASSLLVFRLEVSKIKLPAKINVQI